jgi:hypothetical protein
MEDRSMLRDELRTSGGQVVEKAKELIHEGNVRHLQIKQVNRVVIDLPLTLVAVGVIIAPVAAALGAFAAVATGCSISVNREAAPGDAERYLPDGR